MHILHVVGARPNFMKAAPVLRALQSHSSVRQTLVHTGQHYDSAMSDIFFQQLGMPEPDRNLGVGCAYVPAIGAVQRWSSRKMSGVMRVTQSVPDERVAYDLNLACGQLRRA